MSTVHFVEQERLVFVHWKPGEAQRLAHRIYVSPSGDFEVTCYHDQLDIPVIRSQVGLVIARKLREKKDQ